MVSKFVRSNARSFTLVAFSLLLGTAARRLGWKWTTVLCAVCCTIIIERHRRLDRLRILQERAIRRARMQQMWGQDTVFMLIRDANGVISPIRPSHLALMLREDDFTAEDYETLLALDQEIPGVKNMSASEDEISRLPTKVIEKNTGENCCICLDQLKEGDLAKTMTCQKHTFHAACLDEWLHHKGTCPLCLEKCSISKLQETTTSSTSATN